MIECHSSYDHSAIVMYDNFDQMMKYDMAER